MLGLINFLAGNQTIKIIVLLNKSEIDVIDKINIDKSNNPFNCKFRTNFTRFSSTENVISQVITEDKSLSDFHKNFLILYFKNTTFRRNC